MLAASQTPAQVFIPYFDAGPPRRLLSTSRRAPRRRPRRSRSIPNRAKLGKQLQYADRKGFRVAVIAGEREFAAGECQVKDLSSGESTTVPLADGATAVIAEIQRILAK